MSKRPFLWFVLLNLLVVGAVFRGALWGGRLLAPLDLGPALLTKYRFVDPSAGAVPANHYISDQFAYDLPLQYTVYRAYRRGEVPWWDPYTWSGRPLLADAHVNGTAPIRLLCYAVLPFELAYNWTRIIHSFLTGLGMFLLLRRWGMKGAVAVLLALSYQFAGFQALSFGHPWLEASLLCYPWLWLAWESWWRGPNAGSVLLATLAVAGVFYSGNLQSHAYLVLFALAFLVGYGGRSRAAWGRGASIVAVSGALGVLLAAPVLGGQLEAFACSQRGVGHPFRPLNLLSGLMSCSAVYPWLLGTFRTLDVSKIFEPRIGAVGFGLFIGSAGVALALLGAGRGAGRPGQEPVRRTALALVAIYLVVVSTPLVSVFYLRLAGWAVLGLVVLAALGAQRLEELAGSLWRFGRGLLVLALSLALVTNLLALVVYPKLLPRIRAFVENRSKSQSRLGDAPALRSFQVENLANEVSFKNPETVPACLGLAALAALCCSARWRRWQPALPLVLTLNLLPQLLFYQRFVPNHPIALWQRLLAGGPEQKKLMDLMQDQPLRLFETTKAWQAAALPYALPHLYRVRMVNGYSALQPKSLISLLPSEWSQYRRQVADLVYDGLEAGQAIGVLETNATPGTVLFQWLAPNERPFQVQSVSLNGLRLEFSPGPAGTLVWTDTYYRGWRAWSGAQELRLQSAPPCFSHLEIPADAKTVVLRYEPTYLRLGKGLALLGLVALAGIGLFGRKLRRVLQPRDFSPRSDERSSSLISSGPGSSARFASPSGP